MAYCLSKSWRRRAHKSFPDSEVPRQQDTHRDQDRIRTCVPGEIAPKFHWHIEEQGMRHAYIKRGTPQLNGVVKRSQEQIVKIFVSF